MTISFKDRVFHRELHHDAETARQVARALRREVSAEFARLATGRGDGPSIKQVRECNDADDLAEELNRREYALVDRIFS